MFYVLGTAHAQLLSQAPEGACGTACEQHTLPHAALVAQRLNNTLPHAALVAQRLNNTLPHAVLAQSLLLALGSGVSRCSDPPACPVDRPISALAQHLQHNVLSALGGQAGACPW